MLPPFSLNHAVIFVLLFSWLGACVVFDLRLRLVPAWLTIFPLVLVAVWRLSQGGWQMVLLVILLILISDLSRPEWRIPLASTACLGCVLALSAVGTLGNLFSLMVIFAVWAAWERGATGGADAKIILTLVLLFANGWIFIPIILVGGIQGVMGLMSRQKTIPYTVAITLGTLTWLWLSAMH